MAKAKKLDLDTPAPILDEETLAPRDADAGRVVAAEKVSEMLERRYRELESSNVQPIDGEEAYQRLMAKTEEHRHRSK
jgi:hypothetical protein